LNISGNGNSFFDPIIEESGTTDIHDIIFFKILPSESISNSGEISCRSKHRAIDISTGSVSRDSDIERIEIDTVLISSSSKITGPGTDSKDTTRSYIRYTSSGSRVISKKK